MNYRGVQRITREGEHKEMADKALTVVVVKVNPEKEEELITSITTSIPPGISP